MAIRDDAERGNANHGTLFRLHPDGSDYHVLHHFEGATADGDSPFGPVFESEPGVLHGMASYGGTNSVGAIYTLHSDGTGYQLLRSFTGDVTDGAVPFGGLSKGADGALYGTTWYGGPADKGTFFRLHPDGSGYEVLHYFTGAGGGASEPYAGVTLGSNGDLYGTSWGGGNAYKGTVYRIDPETREIEVLHHFVGGAVDGQNPYGNVIEGTDGVLYGTTVQGGTANYGTLYKLNPDGTGFAILRSFVSTSGGGYFPYGGLIQGSDGVLYGTTAVGGTAGFGLVFQINRNGGSYKVLRNFLGGNDGAQPYAGVVEASDGLLYGVTAYGGGSDRGTVFRVKRGGGDYSVLWRFSANDDPKNPFSRLLEGADGNLYGATSTGGGSDSGTVFRLARNGDDQRLLYAFNGTAAEGISALGGLSAGADGLLYGTTALGGQWGLGTLFSIEMDGNAFTVRHHFAGEPTDGGNPSGELIRVNDGMYYGTCRLGGFGCGTVYRLAPQVSLALAADGLVRWAGPTGFVYQVQASPETLTSTSWQILTNVSGASGQFPLPGFAEGTKQFIRARVGPEP